MCSDESCPYSSAVWGLAQPVLPPFSPLQLPPMLGLMLGEGQPARASPTHCSTARTQHTHRLFIRQWWHAEETGWSSLAAIGCTGASLLHRMCKLMAMPMQVQGLAACTSKTVKQHSRIQVRPRTPQQRNILVQLVQSRRLDIATQFGSTCTSIAAIHRLSAGVKQLGLAKCMPLHADSEL